MKTSVIPSRRYSNAWTVQIKQGHQYFTLDYNVETRKEAAWMARMFRTALKKHNEELLKKFKKEFKIGM